MRSSFFVAVVLVGGCSLTDLSGFSSGGLPVKDAGAVEASVDAAIADAGDVVEASNTVDASPPGCGAGLADGLVAYWLFEEGTGTSLQDCSLNHVTGTLTGDATWGAGRRTDTKALWITRATMTLAENSAFDFRGSFSIAAWVWFADGHNSGIISRGDQVNDRGWSIEMEGDRTLSFYLSSNGSDLIDLHSDPAPTTTWIHVAMVLDAGKSRTIYLNGQSVVAASVAPTTLAKPKSRAEVGHAWGACCDMEGRLDELRVYARALTADEVAILAKD